MRVRCKNIILTCPLGLLKGECKDYLFKIQMVAFSEPCGFYFQPDNIVLEGVPPGKVFFGLYD